MSFFPNTVVILIQFCSVLSIFFYSSLSLLQLFGQFSVSVCTGDDNLLHYVCNDYLVCTWYITNLLISVDSLTAEFVYNVVFIDTVLGVTV